MRSPPPGMVSQAGLTHTLERWQFSRCENSARAERAEPRPGNLALATPLRRCTRRDGSQRDHRSGRRSTASLPKVGLRCAQPALQSQRDPFYLQ